MRVEEQYPLSIDNEELNALLTTIRNQEQEIETLNKEVSSMRKNIEHFNEEHLLRENKTEAEAAPAEKTPSKKTTDTKKDKAPRAKAKKAQDKKA